MTQIFNSYEDFLKRGDGRINGVSLAFSQVHEDWEEMNETNNGCWNCSDCSYCSHCSYCSDCYLCSWCSWCSCCSNCSDCSTCSDCYRCSGCVNCFDSGFQVPVITNIHQKVYEVVNGKKEALDMSSNWHTCETTHCRAGWVVHLAGVAGYDLESKTSTAFAAMQIYKKSSQIKVSPARFHDSNEEAMADIKRCAGEEKQLSK